VAEGVGVTAAEGDVVGCGVRAGDVGLADEVGLGVGDGVARGVGLGVSAAGDVAGTGPGDGDCCVGGVSPTVGACGGLNHR
jgi:hypothetical protein